MAATARAAGLGFAAGVVGGLFGVGGGIVVVPGLVLWLHLVQHRASATSVAAIVASSAAALTAFALDGSVDWWAALLLFIGSGTGAAIGARSIEAVPERWLARAFTALLVITAVRLALG